MDGLTADKPMNSYAYRQYLINNAGSLLNQSRTSAYQGAVCGPCMQPYNVGTMMPEMYKTVCDGQACSKKLVDPRGLGVGRDYGAGEGEESAKATFMQRKEQEQERLATNANCCAASAVDRLNYFAPAGTQLPMADVRASVPSGGYPMSGGDAVKVV
jgi:hypothetical protein